MNGMVSIVVTLCHLVTVDPAKLTITACFERIAAKVPMQNVNQCGMQLAKVADWFGKSEYADGTYFIGAIKCAEGDYHVDSE